MSPSHVNTASDAESLSLLVKRIADRDRLAFGLLYRRLVRSVFAQARAGLGSAAVAVPVTRGVFVEVWRLAPISDRYRADVRAWVDGITAARIAARLPVPRRDLQIIDTSYDEHISCELTAILSAAPLIRISVGSVVGDRRRTVESTLYSQSRRLKVR
jgi:DNA-directed RNA polymerase specialized sigma24 family protein